MRRFALFTHANTTVTRESDAWRPTTPAPATFDRRTEVDDLFRERRAARFRVGERWRLPDGTHWEIAWISPDERRIDVRELVKPRPLVWSTSRARLVELLAAATLVPSGD